MNARAILLIASAATMLVAAASRRTSSGSIEAGAGDLGTFSPGALLDDGRALIDRITERGANVMPEVAEENVRAFLVMLAKAEGTFGRGDYAAVYGYGHTITNFADHPAVTGEWAGVTLPDRMCELAGYGPGCKSTAAGRYQIIKPTWLALKRQLGLRDFSPASQDQAALRLIADHGALQDVRAGRVADAIRKVRSVWASLPGNYAGQGQRTLQTLLAWFSQDGGSLA